MIHWMWVVLAFVIGEFVGLLAFEVFFRDKPANPPKKKWWNELNKEE